MAEIPIERKPNHAWPWVLLALLLLALLAWWFLSRRGRDAGPVSSAPAGVVSDSTAQGTPGGNAADTTQRVGGALVNGVPVNAAVSSFITFDENQRAGTAADTSHDYTAEGLRRLAVALEAVAKQDSVTGISLRPRLLALVRRAADLQRNPLSTKHAEYTRDAFVEAASIMGAIQQRRFPGLGSGVAQVTSAANAVQPNTLLLQQKPAIQKFFDTAADALRSMSGADTSGTAVRH